MDAEDRLCANHESPGTCNWLAAEPGGEFCAACTLNEVAPDLSDPRRAGLYYEVEKAKRRLLFSLYSFGLPVEDARIGKTACRSAYWPMPVWTERISMSARTTR